METVKTTNTTWGVESDKINKNFIEITTQTKDSDSSTVFTDNFFSKI